MDNQEQRPSQQRHHGHHRHHHHKHKHKGPSKASPNSSNGENEVDEQPPLLEGETSHRHHHRHHHHGKEKQPLHESNHRNEEVKQSDHDSGIPEISCQKPSSKSLRKRSAEEHAAILDARIAAKRGSSMDATQISAFATTEELVTFPSDVDATSVLVQPATLLLNSMLNDIPKKTKGEPEMVGDDEAPTPMVPEHYEGSDLNITQKIRGRSDQGRRSDELHPHEDAEPSTREEIVLEPQISSIQPPRNSPLSASSEPHSQNSTLPATDGDIESNPPSLLMLEATLVTDQSVYDAVPVPNDAPLPWWRKYQRCIFGGMGLLVGLAVAVGLSFGMRNSTNGNASKEPEQFTSSTTQPSQSTSQSPYPTLHPTVQSSSSPLLESEQFNNSSKSELSQSNSSSSDPSLYPTLNGSSSLLPSSSTTPTIPKPCYEVKINFLTDRWPEEIRWTLTRILSMDIFQLVLEGSPKNATSLYTDEVCVEAGEYDFTIYDSGEDGLCCSDIARWDGYYNITVDGIVVAQGGEFDEEESVTFSLPIASSTSSQSSVLLSEMYYWGASGSAGQAHQDILSPRNSEVTVIDVSAGYQYSILVLPDGTAQTGGFIDVIDYYKGHLGLRARDISEGENEFQTITSVFDGRKEAITDAPYFIKAYAGAQNQLTLPGTIHSILIDAGGQVWATGSNSNGQLCLGDYNDRLIPQYVPIDGYVISAAIGSTHTLLLLDDGSVYGCGSNEMGQLGFGADILEANIPTLVEGMKNVESLSAGLEFSLFKSSDGLFVTGSNFYGQLCVESNVGGNIMSPELIDDVSVRDVATFEAIKTSSFILFNDGSVGACGRNNLGQLGDGSNQDRVRALLDPLPDEVAIRKLGVGPSSESVFCIDDNGVTYATGLNDRGQLGVGDLNNRNVLTKVSWDLRDVDKISASEHNVLSTGGHRSSPTTPTPCYDIQINIQTDEWPEETSWTLTRIISEDIFQLVLEGSPKNATSLHTDEVCVEAGEYDFTIFDSGEDGLIGYEGDPENGHYNITVDGMVIAQGGEFGEAETVTFSVPSASSPTSQSTVASQPSNLSSLQSSLKQLFPENEGIVHHDSSENVAVFGCTAVIGAPYNRIGEDSGRGLAFVFVNDANNEWSQQARLIAPGGAEGDKFGWSVGIYGDTLIVGAPYEVNNGGATGSAHIFVRSGVTWTHQAKLLPPGGVESDYFGYSARIYKDTAIVGAYGDDENGDRSGSAHVFVRSGDAWTHETKLLAPDGVSGDRFGSCVRIYDKTIIVGAPTDHNENGDLSGSVYIFAKDEATWTYDAKILPPNGAPHDSFGTSIGIHKDTIIASAINDNDNGENSGSAHIFVRDDAGWTHQAKLVATDAAANSEFGYSVGIYNDTAIVGAWKDDYNGEDSGAAYIFVRNADTWTHQAKVINEASSDWFNGAVNDQFGQSVCIHDDTALVSSRTGDTLAFNINFVCGVDFVTNITTPKNDVGEDCSVDLDCNSGVCGRVGDESKADTYIMACCDSGKTYLYGSRIYCTDQPLGRRCPHDPVCASNRCDDNECKYPKSDDGGQCQDHDDCNSQVCGRVGRIDGTGYDEKCCTGPFETYTPPSGTDLYCTGQDVGRYCDFDEQCSTGKCIDSKCAVSNVGEDCGVDLDCNSGVCGRVGDERSPGGYGMACCESNRTYLFGSRIYCKDQPIGKRCPHDPVCASGLCVDDQCVSSENVFRARKHSF